MRVLEPERRGGAVTAPASAVKVASCADCGTPIIGACLRCPVCQDQHAEGLLRSTWQPMWQLVFAWLFTAQVIVVAVVFLILAGKGCQ